AKMVCAARQMVCAARQNDVRSWQNGLRAILDGRDVLGKMICALICAWFAVGLRLVCARGPEVPVAQRKSFSSDLAIEGIQSITALPLESLAEASLRHCSVSPPSPGDRGAKCFYLITVL